ncbi:MAG: amidase family protein [Hyphomicrobiaceae bacterium]|nr:amidase family protein [Hyphomicrobiaceae bacterium]
MTISLADYARHDATGLAELVRSKAVNPKELAEAAMRGIEKVNPLLNAVVETYPDRIEALDEKSLGNGPFRGVPFLMKDVFGHEGGRKIEFGSRLCQGMTAQSDSYYCMLVKAAGLNIIGRSAAPEYSLTGTTETALYGSTSTPWRKGYSAGGSSGGSAAAVSAGIVAMAHGSDIGGSIRIPASWCGGVGLKPSRGRISFGPALDENGFGLAMNFVQVRTVRDAAAMLDCLAKPQTGDPFVIPKPDEPYLTMAGRPAPRLRIGWTVKPLLGAAVDPEIVAAVKATAKVLEAQGHDVFEHDPEFDGAASVRRFTDMWFFGFDARMDGYAAKTGREVGPKTLEPVTLAIYEHARRLKAVDFFAAVAEVNSARRKLAKFYERADIWLSPMIAKVSEPWGNYNLGRTDVTMDDLVEKIYRVPCQYSVPHNIMGTPAISLPLAQHASGLPIGVQLAGKPATEHLLLQLATVLEQAMPWAGRVPGMHVGR